MYYLLQILALRVGFTASRCILTPYDVLNGHCDIKKKRVRGILVLSQCKRGYVSLCQLHTHRDVCALKPYVVFYAFMV